jgi:hypothetical protein
VLKYFGYHMNKFRVFEARSLKFDETKNWLVAVWSSCVKKNNFFSIFYFGLHISQAFQEHQAHQILTLYEPMVKFCLKWVFSSFFLYFMKTPTCSQMAKTEQRLKGRVLRKKFVLSIISWFSTFLSLFLFVHSSP